MVDFKNLTYTGLIITDTMTVMHCLFTPVLFFSLIGIPYLLKITREIKNYDKIVASLLILVFLFGFCLRNAGYSYGTNVDGIHYVEMAKSIFKNRLFTQGCAVGQPSACDYYYESVVMPGYPYLVVLLFRLFGIYDSFAMFISGIFGSLNVVFIFILYYLIFKDARGSLFASLVYCFLPLDIYSSSTASARPTAIFFMNLSLIFYLLSFEGTKREQLLLLIAAVLSLSWTIYIRPEYYFLLIPMTAIGILKKRRFAHNDAHQPASLFPTALFFIHQIPAISWFLHRNFGLTGGDKPTFSPTYLDSFSGIASLLFSEKREIGFPLFNPLHSAIFIIGSLSLIAINKHRRKALFLLLTFLFVLSGTAFFYHGSTGSEILRYLHPAAVPYSMLCGLAISEFFPHSPGKKNRYFCIISLFIFLSFVFIPRQMKLKIFQDERQEEWFIEKNMKLYDQIEPQSLVFMLKPQVFNIDLLEHKDLNVVSYGTNEIWEYPNYNRTLLNQIRKESGKKWYLIYSRTFKNEDTRKNPILEFIRNGRLIKKLDQGELILYEIQKNEDLLRDVERFAEKFPPGR